MNTLMGQEEDCVRRHDLILVCKQHYGAEFNEKGDLQLIMHTIARRSGINPGNPLSISDLTPRKTKLMAAGAYGYPLLI